MVFIYTVGRACIASTLNPAETLVFCTVIPVLATGHPHHHFRATDIFQILEHLLFKIGPKGLSYCFYWRAAAAAAAAAIVSPGNKIFVETLHLLH